MLVNCFDKSPNVTSVNTASATLNGCTTSKQFTVNVNPCTGIEADQNDGHFLFFPNPVKDLLTIESSAPTNIVILDLKEQ